MKTAQLVLILIVSTAPASAQLSMSAAAAKERYLQRTALANKINSETLARIAQTHENEIKSAQEEMKRGFDALIQSAAIRNQTDEVRQLTLQREALLTPHGEGSPPNGIAAAGQGTRYEELVGVWTTPPGSNFIYTFEFKGNKEVLYTYESKSESGAYKNTTRYRASEKSDRIVCSSSRSSDTHYEIALPFNPNDLRITHHYESSTGGGSRTYKLVRKP